MKFKVVLSLLILLICTAAIIAQTELTIKKKTSIKIPGMEDMPKLPNGMANPLKDRTSTVYIKGMRMRTDSQMQVPKIGMFSGGMKTVTFSDIMQCDKQRTITFSSDKKKYYQDSFGGPSSQDVQKLKKGGYVTMTGSVTDTGNRAKLFGYEAKHLKQIFTITPSKDACMKENLTVEMEGWYADLPEFTCPIKRKVQDFEMDTKCYDQVIDQVKGAITGFALKEIKKITMQGQTITLEEEVVSINKTTLADSLFEAPANYTAANTLKEIQDDTDGESNSQMSMPSEPNISTNTSTSSFPMPAAGIEAAPIGEKKAGMIRIGVVMPKVTTPESKNDPSSGEDIAIASRNYLVELLKTENIEAIALESNSEDEAKKRACDYILYANVTQKRGGGGMFKSMVLMGAATMAGAMIPGVGGIIASTVAGQVMGQTMGKTAKAKDEFSFDYKVVGMDKSVLSQALSKKKSEKDGEDVLTPQIKEASTKILTDIANKQPK